MNSPFFKTEQKIEDKKRKEQNLLVVVPGDVADSAVHAGSHAARVIRHNAFSDVDQVNLADGFGLHDVVEVELEQLHDPGHVAAIADL